MFSQKIVEGLGKSSLIRAMFEEGERLKKIYGPENVFDFSIGNPEAEPPREVQESIRKYTGEEHSGIHRYMSNAGFADVREKVAAYMEKKSGVAFSKEQVLMVCGAAAGLNITLKALLNPGEEVIVLSPYFVEYLTYIDNAGGTPVIVKTVKDTFRIDVEAVEKAITERTKAIILNSPNNPTGVVYSRSELEKLNDVLKKREEELGIAIYVISDEPYVSIAYDGVEVPSMAGIFKNSITVNSFSKSLALPGERIGYVAASSLIEGAETLMAAMVVLNRTLGFVNAPALFQKVVADNLDTSVEIEYYKQNRDLLYSHLTSLGFTCVKPEGAFYLFLKSPVENETQFCKKAVEFNLLFVAGSGFGSPGYVRIAYCYDKSVIERSLDAFTKLAKSYGAQLDN